MKKLTLMIIAIAHTYLFLIHEVDGFDPLSATVAFVAAGINYARCWRSECCNGLWIKANFTALENELHQKLHGQHLVADSVIRSVRGHFTNPNPEKALVLSFHGCTGCGKNFVSKIITSAMYKLGMQSAFIHLFVSTHHFPHEDLIETYKDQLRRWIHGNVSACGRSLFIFDEMDKMPLGLIDAIKPFIDHHHHIDGVDYRKSMFIFLSNNGAEAVTLRTLEHWKSGLPREQLRLMDMEDILTRRAFNEKGGLWHSSLIERSLISVFIPFLPMERQHVKQCIVDDLLKKQKPVSDAIVNQIADMLQYYPEDTRLYSKSGCKRVSQKVDLVLDDD